MKKIVAVVVAGGTSTLYREGDEVPAVEGLIEIGMPVRISNDNLLSNTTKGRVIGFSVNYQKTLLAHVHWLNGAPPIRVNLNSIISSLPKKFWMVVPNMEGLGYGPNQLYSERASMEARARGTVPARRRFWSQEEAVGVAQEQSRTYNQEYIVLQSVAVGNGSELFAL